MRSQTAQLHVLTSAPAIHNLIKSAAWLYPILDQVAGGID